MTGTPKLRDFGLEVFVSNREFSTDHHMTASDAENMGTDALLAMASQDLALLPGSICHLEANYSAFARSF